jgi:hypothetical protein
MGKREDGKMLIEPMKTEDIDPSLKPFTDASTLANMVCHEALATGSGR